MCDTFVALPDATVDGSVIFGKNSDRPAGEIQDVGGKVAKLSPAATETLKLLSCIGCIKIFPHSRWEASFSDCLWRFTMAFTVFLSKCNSLAMKR